MRALVTGASGFLGGYLVDELRRRGWTVTGLVRSSSDANGLKDRGIRVVQGDVTDPRTLEAPMVGQDAIFHLAAVVGKNPGGWAHHYEVGVRGTQHVIDAAARSGTSRFVHVSSCAVYRCKPGTAISEGTPYDENPEPWNHYVRQKVLSEQAVWRAHREGRIRATTIRPSTMLGAGDPNLVGQMQAIMSSPLGRVANDGRNHFPVVVVEDVVSGIVEAAQRDVAVGKAYNLSGRDPITKDALLHLFQEAGLHSYQRRAIVQFAIDAAAAATRAMERPSRLLRYSQTPPTTRLAIALLELHASRRVQQDCIIDSSRAVADLGWQGRSDYGEAIRRAMVWHLELEEQRG